MSPIAEAREKVVAAALLLAYARQWTDLQVDAGTRDATLGYASDQLDEALDNWGALAR